ncbi:MAG TPA: NAD(P)-binding domain-containing protein [Candidatus Tectomicrobia bacterium]|nr:NAD(P)-binding domain-containing protein [Candidatus Tectomicrobia bacterium]
MLDVVIVGARAAGLSAALTAHNQGLSYVVDTTREELLEKWSELSQQYMLNVREQEGVAELQAVDEGFQVKSDKDTYYAKRIILAVGTQGNLGGYRRPGQSDPFFREPDTGKIAPLRQKLPHRRGQAHQPAGLLQSDILDPLTCPAPIQRERRSVSGESGRKHGAVCPRPETDPC